MWKMNKERKSSINSENHGASLSRDNEFQTMLVEVVSLGNAMLHPLQQNTPSNKTPPPTSSHREKLPKNIPTQRSRTKNRNRYRRVMLEATANDAEQKGLGTAKREELQAR